jgi:putative aldouronate transport system substrate-binding protein
MKKTMTLALTLTLAFSVLLSACTKDAATTNSPTATIANTTSAPEIKPGSLPLSTEKVTLKVMITSDPQVENFATNEFTKYLEEQTNVHIEWEVVPRDNAQEKLNLVLAGGDYPDIFMNMGISPAQQTIYGEQGVFVPLNNYIDKYGVEAKRIFERSPVVKESITAPDGNIYSLPQINDCYHCSMSQKMWIYKPWLDALNLPMPTTTEEFYQVLKAFKEKDPNKNSKADEIPLASSISGWHYGLEEFIMNSFTTYNAFDNNSKGLIVQDGKIDTVYNKPEWKAGLEYLHKLYSEGLIAPESFTQDVNQLKQITENKDAERVGAVPMGYMGEFTEINGESGRWLQYTSVPPLKGPTGVQNAAYNSLGGFGMGTFVITKASKNPDIAFRWADNLYTFENTLRSTLGRPDMEWKKPSANDVGLNGKPALYVSTTNFGNVQNIHWNSDSVADMSSDFRLGNSFDGKDNLEAILYNETKKNYEPYIPKTNINLPYLFFSNESSSELVDLQKTINDYRDQMLARFVIGDASLDKDWDTYVKTLESMNLKRYLQIFQEAYDQNQKK